MAMKKFIIIAYAETEGHYYLPRVEAEIYATNHKEAERRAWDMFPGYHEIGAFEVEE